MASSSPKASTSTATATDPEEWKLLTLVSSDGYEYTIEESVAIQSLTIKHMVEEEYTRVPLPNIDSDTLIIVAEYMENHADLNEEEIKNYDKEFVKRSFDELYVLVLAANYLDIKSMMDLLCQSIANRIKNKSVNAVRKIFNVTNDYTPEEEEEVRKEHEWAYEGVEFDESLD